MNTLELENLTIPELEQVIGEAQSIIKKKQKSAKKDFLKQVRELAKNQGLNFDDVMGKATPKSSTKSNAEPKYRNPSDSSQTWTGKGRKPNWLIERLEQNESLESFAI